MFILIAIMITLVRIGFNLTEFDDAGFCYLFGAALIEGSFEGFGFIAFMAIREKVRSNV